MSERPILFSAPMVRAILWVCPEHVLNEAGGNPSHTDATVVVTVRAVRVWRAE